MNKIFWVGFVLNLACSFAKKLPSEIHLCKPEDVACIAKVATDVIQGHPNGYPELGLPNLEPLAVKSLIINQGSSGPLNLDLSFNNIDSNGLSKLTVTKATGFGKDPKTSKFEFSVRVPKFSLKGGYKMSGRILILPIEGEGDAEVVLDDVDIDVKFKPTITEKDGHIIIGVDKVKLQMKPTNIKMHFTNLFNGDKALGDNMNAFLNENSKAVWGELAQGIDGGIAEILKGILKNIFHKFYYDEIYSVE